MHFKSDAGVKSLTAEEADKLKITNPDFHTQDLFEHIEKGNAATWTLKV